MSKWNTLRRINPVAFFCSNRIVCSCVCLCYTQEQEVQHMYILEQGFVQEEKRVSIFVNAQCC